LTQPQLKSHTIHVSYDGGEIKWGDEAVTKVEISAETHFFFFVFDPIALSSNSATNTQEARDLKPSLFIWAEEHEG